MHAAIDENEDTSVIQTSRRLRLYNDRINVDGVGFTIETQPQSST